VRVILVHGGGPEISVLMTRLNKQPVFVDGLRVTDQETVDIVQMVLAGKINKSLVNLIETRGGEAIGLSGMDGRMIQADMRDEKYGFVGDVTKINSKPILDLLDRGYHHVTIDLFDTRMDEAGLKAAAEYQKFLVGVLGFAAKANLVGMSWGGFFSTRYAAEHPENVRRIYLDAPLLNFDGFGNPDYGRIGVWADRKPADGVWTADPEMPINKAVKIAKAKIPVLLIYGCADTVVPVSQNCRIFAARFKAAGGEISEIPRGLFGHHPHGLDPDSTGPIVDFFQ
jgi:pimeloyl-ACP methyl ester carboxylesterase